MRYPPAPPRLTGDTNADMRAIADWFNDFFTATVRENGVLNPDVQGDVTAFDVNNPPSPSDTTIGLAQATANAALTRANSATTAAAAAQDAADAAQAAADAAQGRADDAYTLAGNALTAAPFFAGQVTVDQTGSGAATFAATAANTTYAISAVAVSSSGSPADLCFTVASVSKTTAGFTITTKAAPAAGKSVTFDVMARYF